MVTYEKIDQIFNALSYGTHIKLEGTVYIKIQPNDLNRNHTENMLVNCTTGALIHYTRVITPDNVMLCLVKDPKHLQEV
jgi:hypothetical protein